jgi:hypothetical protein
VILLGRGLEDGGARVAFRADQQQRALDRELALAAGELARVEGDGVAGAAAFEVRDHPSVGALRAGEVARRFAVGSEQHELAGHLLKHGYISVRGQKHVRRAAKLAGPFALAADGAQQVAVAVEDADLRELHVERVHMRVRRRPPR